MAGGKQGCVLAQGHESGGEEITQQTKVKDGQQLTAEDVGLLRRPSADDPQQQEDRGEDAHGPGMDEGQTTAAQLAFPPAQCTRLQAAALQRAGLQWQQCK